MGGDVPSAESLVGWLLEHPELQVPEFSESDSMSEPDGLSDSDSEEEVEGAFGETEVSSNSISFVLLC